jgi:hypothetical protein
MVQINLTITEEDLQKWRDYANGQSLAKIIKETMNKAIFKVETKKDDIKEIMLNEFRTEQAEFKAQMNANNEQIFQLLKQLPQSPSTGNHAEIQQRILLFLTDHPDGMKRDKLGKYLGMDSDEGRKTVRVLLSDMKDQQLVTYDSITELWRLT